MTVTVAGRIEKSAASYAAHQRATESYFLRRSRSQQGSWLPGTRTFESLGSAASASVSEMWAHGEVSEHGNVVGVGDPTFPSSDHVEVHLAGLW
ncbi:MAG TPA: hypothetical protein VFN60_11270 [Acidimicrobiales bacterium]|nr:hypothetical protein [Acidimicrobiales bacterium]